MDLDNLTFSVIVGVMSDVAIVLWLIIHTVVINNQKRAIINISFILSKLVKKQSGNQAKAVKEG